VAKNASGVSWTIIPKHGVTRRVGQYISMSRVRSTTNLLGFSVVRAVAL
jgi:hypothetical protein